MSTGAEKKMSSDSRCAIYWHLLFAVLPIMIPLVLGFVVGLLFRGKTLDIASPQEALSNLSGLLSDVLGFLIGFVMLTLGFTSTNTLHVILRFPATKFEYIANMFVPIIYGFLLVGGIACASAMIESGCALTLSLRKLIICAAAFAAFACSMLKCLSCFFKMVSSVAKESEKEE